MKFTEAIRINLKKLQFRTSKALFLILPIAILVALSIIISSQVKNFQTAMDQNIFDEIEEENTLIELQYQVEHTSFMGSGMGKVTEDSSFSEIDMENIKLIEGVKTTSINYDLPVSLATSDDLFETTIYMKNISAMPAEMASLYTADEFAYTEGESIPIVLNAASFVEMYEDWNGQDTITVDFRALRESGGDPFASTPTRSQAIDYDKLDLVGQTFSITFGGIEPVATYSLEREMGVNTFAKLTTEEIEEMETNRKSDISEYWDYDMLADGVTYEFVVAGVIESDSNMSTYIPEDFASTLMQDYLQLQLDSLTADTVDEYLLNTTFSGLTYDGMNLANATTSGGGGGGGMSGALPGALVTDNAYKIPGLVVEVSEYDSTDVIGLYTDVAVFDDSLKTGDTISIILDSIFSREDVVREINSLGYAFQDISDLDALEEVQSTLDSISVSVVVIFILLTVSVIILTMSRFVSDSTKEIGIFRAVGFTKKNILSLFLTQSIIYVGVGYIIGAIIGVVGNIGASNMIGSWFTKFVEGTVQETVGVVGEIDYSVFTRFDSESFILLSVVLLVITIVISYIPAMNASKISPVEAIKSE